MDAPPKIFLLFLTLRTESVSYTTLMGTPPLVQPMLVISSLRITCLHYTYGCQTLSVGYVCMFYLDNQRGTLHLQVSNVTFSLLLLAPPTESLACTTLMGAPPQMQPMLVTSSSRITCLHNTYRCPTLSEAYVCMFYLQNHWRHYTYGCLALSLAYCCQLPLQNNWVTLHLLMLHLKLSICWLLFPSESLCFTSLMGVQP